MSIYRLINRVEYSDNLFNSEFFVGFLIISDASNVFSVFDRLSIALHACS